MSLTDIVSGLDVTWAPRLALVLFLLVFVLLVARLWRRGHRAAHASWASLPLEEAPVVSSVSVSKGSKSHG